MRFVRPTLGAVLCKAILIKKLSVKKIYRLDCMVKETRLDDVKQLKKENSDFSSPVTLKGKSLGKMIENVHNDAMNICIERLTKKEEIDNIAKSILKLFDVTNCKCSILFCNESNCVGCERKVIINCSSENTASIPLMELDFVQAPRTKEGRKSSSCDRIKRIQRNYKKMNGNRAK